MKAATIIRHGGPEVFQIRERESRPLGSDEVRVRVSAAGVNFADIMMREGLYPEAPKPPFVPGYEISGTVSEVGPLVKTLHPGERVLAGTRFGGYSNEVVVSESQLRRIPDGLDFEQAAAVPVNFLTAWFALSEMGRVRSGDRVLVPSAAGGVGLAAVQIAARAGAHVVGLVGDLVKAPAVKSAGAAEVITNQRWETVDDRSATGFDIILDASGADSLKRAFRRLGPAGRVVSFGASRLVAGDKRSLARAALFFLRTPFFHPLKLMNENKGVYGLNMLRIFEHPEAVSRAMDAVMAGFRDGQYKVVVGKTFPLSQAGAAHSHLLSRSNIGKVVLVCD